MRAKKGFSIIWMRPDGWWSAGDGFTTAQDALDAAQEHKWNGAQWGIIPTSLLTSTLCKEALDD